MMRFGKPWLTAATFSRGLVSLDDGKRARNPWGFLDEWRVDGVKRRRVWWAKGKRSRQPLYRMTALVIVVVVVVLCV